MALGFASANDMGRNAVSFLGSVCKGLVTHCLHLLVVGPLPTCVPEEGNAHEA